LRPADLRKSGKMWGSEPFLTPHCPEYPAKLKNLNVPPSRLFYKGLPPSTLPNLGVAVVGSRKASSYGRSFAHRLGSALAAKGACVISGLALGIDGAAHRGVLQEIRRNPQAAPPIAVLGHGWGTIYPSQHDVLFQQVAEHGTVFTEYEPGAPATRWTFPARNRIIAALCDHLVVVEAGPRSGTLHTARFAQDLERTLWVVPNSPGRPNSKGVLKLWKGGAELITDLDEFVETVAPSRVSSEAMSNSRPHCLEDPLNRELFHLLCREEGVVDKICHDSRWSPTMLAYRLTELEIGGLTKRMIDGTWEIRRWDLASDLGEQVPDH